MTNHRQTSFRILDDAIRNNGGTECQQLPDVFYPEDIFERDGKRLAEMTAKAVCARCPIIEACRNYALETGEVYGVWGGLLASER
jgi:WhiB family redox-sensing transcriptional regulator